MRIRGQEVVGMELKVAFRFERETKRTYRFMEESDEPVVGTLYIQQSAFDRRPDRIEVAIRTVE